MSIIQSCNCYPNFLKRFIFILFGVLLFSGTNAQTSVTVTGKVTDPYTKNSLANVSVQIKGTSIGVVTSEDGIYSISVPVGGVLVYSYLNYPPQEIIVSRAGTMNVQISSQPKEMDEVVVIGYGSRKKKDVTGAVSTVSSKEIEQSTAMTPELALQGRAAGVFIESGGGAPGARPTIRIRGVNTFGYAEPLYVIDGLPIFEGGSGVNAGVIGDIRTPLNIFTLVNPADIESMTVLKDASAAAIYGVRASNGVILITTKKGKSGKPRVEFNGSYGIQNIAKSLKTLNTQQYFELLNESYSANPDANTSFADRFGSLYDVQSSDYVGNGPTYNWQNELKRKNASLQDYNVKVSGGNDNTTYYFSAGYSRTESPLKANHLERYSTALNLESKISKFLQVGVNVRLVQQNAYDNTQSSLGTMISTIPFQPIYYPSDPSGFSRVAAGSFIANPDFDPSRLSPGAPFIFDGNPSLLWGPQTRSNVFAFHRLNDDRYNVFNTLGNAFIQIEPLAGLKIKGSIGGEYRINNRKYFNSFDAWEFNQTPQNPFTNQDGNARGQYGERLAKTFNINKELTVNYSKVFAGEHFLDVLLSASEQYSKWDWNDVSSPVNYTDRQYWAVNLLLPYSVGRTGVLQEDALIGYLGRLSYKFKDRYYFDATFRRDGSSRLAPGNKFDNFPSFGAAWRISEERFFPKTNFINDVKIRGGWGKLGNFQSAGAYQYLSNVSLTPDYPLGSGNGNSTGVPVQGSTLPNFANTSLTWETVQTSSIGFDALLFNNSISFTAEYYNKVTDNIIQSVALPPNTGIQQSADLNIASVRNRGIELQLGYNKKFGEVNFNAGANLTTVNNKVLKLNGGSPIGGEFGRVEEGYSMFYLWGYKVDGIFQNQAEIDAWYARNVKGDANIGANIYKPGDMYFQDVYGDPRSDKAERFSPLPDSAINANDRTYLGKTIPGYYYGFNVGADYKGFDISLFLQGVGDVQRYNSLRIGLEAMSGPANQFASTLNRWTPDNPSTTMPRAVFGDPFGATRLSDRFVESAAYLRLKTLQIGYTLPASVITKLKFSQRIRFYVSGINLLTITKYSGLDPENDILPPTRQFIFGLNASF
jgi:TonB-linked SusC/RagA family outer membrane protein